MFEATMSQLGDYLRQEIEQRGWSLRKAAEKTGLSYTTLRGVVVDPGTPELPTLKKIATGMGLSLARLQDLAGYAPNAESSGDRELRGLTEEQRAFLRDLSPERKRQLIDAIRGLLGE